MEYVELNLKNNVVVNNELKGRVISSVSQKKFNIIELTLNRLKRRITENVEKERIIEYKEKYREKTYNFLISICIEEFGFEEWREDLTRFAFAEYKENKGNFWIAINEKDEVIGTIGIRNTENGNAELKVFYLNKEYRGKGVAKELFGKCMNFIEENGYKKIVLYTCKKFDRAVSFYKKNGFKEVKSIEGRYIYEYIVKDNLIEIEDEFIQEEILEYNAG